MQMKPIFLFSVTPCYAITDDHYKHENNTVLAILFFLLLLFMLPLFSVSLNKFEVTVQILFP